jgi:hypothetical protein
LIGMEACVGAHHLQPQAAFAWPRCAAHASEVRQTVFAKGKRTISAMLK